MFWKKEYSHSPTNNNGCCHNWAENEKRYTYNIRHLYGLEGSRINYRGHSCKALQVYAIELLDVFDGNRSRRFYFFFFNNFVEYFPDFGLDVHNLS